jgi:hypothetical protein
MLSEIKDVKTRYRDRLMSLPNVVSLGVGPKTRDGRLTGTTAIKVFVSRKLPLSDLAEGEAVPEQLDGFETDVEVMEPLSAR